MQLLTVQFSPFLYHLCGLGWRSRYSDSLRAGRFGDRIPVEARFFALVQTGPGAHPASYTMGTGSLSRGAKRPGRGVNHLLPSSTEVKERVGLYLYSLLGPNIFLSTIFSNTFSLCFSLNVRDQGLHPYVTTGKIIVFTVVREITFVFVSVH